jgi:glutathione S-transferase
MSPAPSKDGAEGRVLYRCRVPTNYLCPCGAVARDLGRRSLPHRTERVSLKRAERAEIVELTGQQRVPVLVDGEEVIHDSRRIRQYLEHRYGEGAGEGA